MLKGSWAVEPRFETELCDLKIEGGRADGEHRPVPVLRESQGELEVQDTEQESLATDEGFHDDTEPLVMEF